MTSPEHEAERLRDEIERLNAKHSQLIEISAAEMRKRDDEIERLRERLESNYCYDSAGNKQRVEYGSIPDGIACRDETIKLQDETIKRLQAALKPART